MKIHIFQTNNVKFGLHFTQATNILQDSLFHGRTFLMSDIVYCHTENIQFALGGLADDNIATIHFIHEYGS